MRLGIDSIKNYLIQAKGLGDEVGKILTANMHGVQPKGKTEFFDWNSGCSG